MTLAEVVLKGTALLLRDRYLRLLLGKLMTMFSYIHSILDAVYIWINLSSNSKHSP
jgi:hypothetical protein